MVQLKGVRGMVGTDTLIIVGVFLLLCVVSLLIGGLDILYRGVQSWLVGALLGLPTLFLWRSNTFKKFFK